MKLRSIYRLHHTFILYKNIPWDQTSKLYSGKVRDHTFMTSTRKGYGGFLKFVTCLQILLLFLWMMGISVFLCWLAYLATMHMKSQFPQAWLAHSSREINQITGGRDPLRWLNSKDCESEPSINDVMLRIPLYCKFFDDCCTWL